MHKKRALGMYIGVLLLIIIATGGTAAFAIPQPDFTFWGTVYVNGAALTRDDTDLTITLEVEGQELVRYTMGDNPTHMDYYVLIVPMDDNSAVTDKGQKGDIASIYINSVEVTESPITLDEYGKTVEQDLHASIQFTISGYVLTSVGTGIRDVVMDGLPGNPATSSVGYYSGAVPYGWTGVVTPQKSTYVFSPAERTYTDVTSALSNQDFTGTMIGNKPPSANAGPDQTVWESEEVTLDGSNSYDADDKIFSYSWTQLSGQSVTLSDPSASKPTFTSPVVGTGGESLGFELKVTDYDGQQSTDTCFVNVTEDNVPPVAEAGPDQEVEEGDLVTLNGENSYDPDPDDSIASYVWNQLSGSAVTMSNDAVVQPVFTAVDVGPGGEALVFQLIVADEGGLRSSDTCIVTIKGQNKRPVADAGSDQIVDPGDVVYLFGDGSDDPDGTVVYYSWSQLSGTGVTLSQSNEAIPAFTAPSVGPDGESLVFQLLVTDVGGLQAKDTCVVNVVSDNEPPTADAGPDQTVDEGNAVVLDASGSSDPDGTITVYAWSQVSGAPVSLYDGTTDRPNFTAPEVGPDGESLVFQLKVTDSGGLQDFDEVSVKVRNVEEREGGGKKGGCFIATAAFGSPLEKEVVMLRQMRDEYLIKSGVGRAFVTFYYRHSPPVAKYVSEHRGVRALARAGLYPIVGVSYIAVRTTLLQKLLVVLFFQTVCTAGILIIIRRSWKAGRG
jgi:hypothetical protein